MMVNLLGPMSDQDSQMIIALSIGLAVIPLLVVSWKFVQMLLLKIKMAVTVYAFQDLKDFADLR